MQDEDTRRVAVQRPDGSRYQVELTAVFLHETVPTGPEWRLEVRVPGQALRTFDDRDAFEALIRFRTELERSGEKLLCAGARTDVWPSGMSRDMGGGLRAYVMRQGEQARRADLVHIFDAAAPELVGTVGEQQAYADRWFAFFRDRVRPSG